MMKKCLSIFVLIFFLSRVEPRGGKLVYYNKRSKRNEASSADGGMPVLDAAGNAPCSAVNFPQGIETSALGVENDTQDPFKDRSSQPQVEYTWAEVAERNGENGASIFIAIDNQVYDVTEFAKYHPVGPEPIVKYAGQDATAAVKVMKVDVFRPLLHCFQVGKIVDSQKDNSTATQSIQKSLKNHF